MRVGMGYDVHKLVEGRDLILGGVNIPYEKGKTVYGKYSGWKSIATKKQIKEFMKYN